MSRSTFDSVPVGQRVVVRYLIEDGERATDALGELTARDAASVTVQTRRGEVVIARSTIVAAKEVPPPPPRRRPRRAPGA